MFKLYCIISDYSKPGEEYILYHARDPGWGCTKSPESVTGFPNALQELRLSIGIPGVFRVVEGFGLVSDIPFSTKVPETKSRVVESKWDPVSRKSF